MHEYGNLTIPLDQKFIHLLICIFRGPFMHAPPKVESVQLALTTIDGASIKPGETITYEVAKFELKNEYNTKLKPKILTKKEVLPWQLELC